MMEETDMANLNKQLHKAFGICWHEPFEVDLTIISKGESCFRCRKCHTKYKFNQDLLSQVSIPCDKCGGSGRNKSKCERQGCKDCDNCPFIEACAPCPCQGEPRRITRLQQIMEERGEWTSLLDWIFDEYTLKIYRKMGLAEYMNSSKIIADATKLGLAVKTWKEQTK